jgi:hypothetical protein
VRCFDVSSCPHHATTPITISEYSDELAPYPQLLLTTYDEFGDEEPLPDHPLARLDFNPAGLTFQGLFQTHLQTSGLLTTAWRPIVLGITLSLGSADSLFPDD